MERETEELLRTYARDAFMLAVKGRELTDQGEWGCGLRVLEAAIVASEKAYNTPERVKMLACAHNDRGDLPQFLLSLLLLFNQIPFFLLHLSNHCLRDCGHRGLPRKPWPPRGCVAGVP